MRRLVWLILPVLALAVFLAVPHVAWADETTTTVEETIDDPAEETEEDPVSDPADITAALETANNAIDALEASEEIKARLRIMAEERLREGADRGLSEEELQQLVEQMARLFELVDLEQDLPHLNAACQLLLKGMRSGITAEEVGDMIADKLAAGLDLKTALKEVRFELKGKVPRGQAKKGEDKQHGKPDEPGKPGKPDDKPGKGNGK